MDEAEGGTRTPALGSNFLQAVEAAAAGEDIDPAARPPSPDPNFTPTAQHAFAARLEWSMTPTYAGANHEPMVTLRGPPRLSARPGETIQLQGVASDPDGDVLAVRWWRWKAVDTYPGPITFSHPTSLATGVQVPADATAGQTIHLILEVTDDGAPPLTKYQRVVVTVSR
ncbi:MAG: hypothetical protein OER90_10875 [Gemmatimonadota bacterium]|nr:hypothetical protein [Gemmatimonadota bacterium]